MVGDDINKCKVDKYLINDGKLKKVILIDNELFIVEDTGMVLYREHLDGPLVYEEEAKDLFPEEFI